MNNTSVAIVCIALIATPAGYAVERLYHARVMAALEGTTIQGPQSLRQPGAVPTYARTIAPAWLRQQPRLGDSRPGRV
jgi:hypothetical protein